MSITPNEILNKEFDVRMRGYDRDQINDYLDVIVAEMERLIDENTKLRQDLATAVEKNEYFAQLQESLNSSIVVAQEAADRLKDNSKKEAELILYEAERKASKLVDEATQHTYNIITETDALRRHSSAYRQRLEDLIRHQLDVVTSEEYMDLFQDEQQLEDLQDNVEHIDEEAEETDVVEVEVDEVEVTRPEAQEVEPPVKRNESIIGETIRIEIPSDDE